MRVAAALLLVAALIASPTSASSQKDVLRGNSPASFPISNSSSIATHLSRTSTSKSTTSLKHSLDSSSTGTSSTPTPSSATALSTATSTTPSITSPQSISSINNVSSTPQTSSPTAQTTSRSTTRRTRTHQYNSTTRSSTSHISTSKAVPLSNSTTTTFKSTTRHKSTRTSSGPASSPARLPPGYTITRIPCSTTQNETSNKGDCQSGSIIKIVPTCTPLPPSKSFTQFLIVHTSTVTFTGNRSDYRPPYKPIETPNYCNPNIYPSVPSFVPGSDITWGGFVGSVPMTTETFTVEGQHVTAVLPILGPTEVAHVPISTFITTDKNPSVVYPSDPPPNYSQTWGGGNGGSGDKTPVGGGDSGPVTKPPTYTITAGPYSVIINAQTFTVAPASSSTVTVNGGGVFTIEPTAVIGLGTTIARPPLITGPSSSVLGGIPVTSAGPNLDIGGGTFAIPTSVGTTVVVNGQAVTINSDGVTINGDSMGFLKPTTTSDVLVAGGEMLTAIGRSVVVLHSVTYTYGIGTAPVVQVINGDTIDIEPTGVLVHGSTLGGVSANPTETQYEIVGGATIAKIPPSMVIVNGITYAVGPGSNLRTLVIGDQTLTLGPVGVVMASTTMKFPLYAEVTATITGQAAGSSLPQETGKGEEDAGCSLGPDIRVGLACLGIVVGVFVLG